MLIDGKAIAKQLLAEQESRIAALKTGAATPKLVVVLVGADKSSRVYVNMILKQCSGVGLASELVEFDGDCTTAELVAKIEALNDDASCSGIIVQFPLPKQIDAGLVREAIAPLKDVDSAGTRNIGMFYSGNQCYKPCTPRSMLALLKSVETDLTGKRAVVVGRSHVVGKPIADMLLAENMTVSICHSRTDDLAAYTKMADVVMAATGIKHLINKDMLKRGAIVIDAGIIVEGGKLYGDVDPSGLADVAKAVTPVPGGVGPVTIAMLIDNVVTAFERQHK